MTRQIDTAIKQARKLREELINALRQLRYLDIEYPGGEGVEDEVRFRHGLAKDFLVLLHADTNRMVKAWEEEAYKDD